MALMKAYEDSDYTTVIIFNHTVTVQIRIMWALERPVQLPISRKATQLMYR